MKASLAFANWLHRLRQGLRVRGPLESDPNARTLHDLVFGMATWIGSSIAVMVASDPNLRTPLLIIIVLPFEAGLITAVVFLPCSWLRPAIFNCFLAVSWIFAHTIIVLNGGIRSPAQLMYGTIPISAAWFTGYCAALRTAALCPIRVLLAPRVMHRAGLPILIKGFAPGLREFLVEATLIGAVPVARVLHNRRHALPQADRALREHEAQLERLVAERTAELVEARDQALAANRTRSMFPANMSHQLRAPLNAILGFAEIVSRDASLTDRHRNDLATVSSSGEHLLSLIDDVPDVAWIETGSEKLRLTTFDLREAFNDVMNMLLPSAEAKGLALELESSSGAPRSVSSDAEKLRQILINLIGNAVKYTDSGGVLLRVDAAPATRPCDTVLIFDVEDTGRGISAEDLGTIFDAFVRARMATTNGGTGLGLSVTRHFVALLQGRINVESTPGRGSKFFVEAPLGLADTTSALPGSTEIRQIVGIEAGREPCRILAAEDDPESRVLLTRLLAGGAEA